MRRMTLVGWSIGCVLAVTNACTAERDFSDPPAAGGTAGSGTGGTVGAAGDGGGGAPAVAPNVCISQQQEYCDPLPIVATALVVCGQTDCTHDASDDQQTRTCISGCVGANTGHAPSNAQCADCEFQFAACAQESCISACANIVGDPTNCFYCLSGVNATETDCITRFNYCAGFDTMCLGGGGTGSGGTGGAGGTCIPSACPAPPGQIPCCIAANGPCGWLDVYGGCNPN